MNINRSAQRILQNRRAQLLLPAVLLLPLFVLVIYLLVEVTKVSIAKVRHQFALDNAAYTQMTTVSVFLNATGILNGPLPYRVLNTYREKLEPTSVGSYRGKKEGITVFDLLFQAGAVPTVASDYEWGNNPAPHPDSTDWGVHYAKYEGIETQYKSDGDVKPEDAYDRSGWEKETPDKVKEPVVITNQAIAENFYVPVTDQLIGYQALIAYLNTYVQVGDTFNLQKNLYQKLIKNAGMFREGYYLNVDDCRKDECARQSASRLAPFLVIPTRRQEADNLLIYFSRSQMKGGHSGASWFDFSVQDAGYGKLFFFAYVEPTGRSRLRALKRGVTLKQNFPLPRNHFNIDLTTKYKPYVRTTVILSCPRANNNCVWPNPLPKYSVVLRP